MFNRLLKKHGLEDAGYILQIAAHLFNTLFEAQENPKVIRMLMGHKKVETTMIYNTATTNKYLQKAVDVFDGSAPSEQHTPAPQPAEKPSVRFWTKMEKDTAILSYKISRG
ncbi:MAG: hypothetical protein ACLRSW_12370 [Christensenellaceae bacterium]